MAFRRRPWKHFRVEVGRKGLVRLLPFYSPIWVAGRSIRLVTQKSSYDLSSFPNAGACYIEKNRKPY